MAFYFPWAFVVVLPDDDEADAAEEEEEQDAFNDVPRFFEDKFGYVDKGLSGYHDEFFVWVTQSFFGKGEAKKLVDCGQKF